MKLTFKQYIDSKLYLKEKAKEVSIVQEERTVTTYCKIPSYIIKDVISEQEISLKPKIVIVFERVIVENKKTIRSFSLKNHDKESKTQTFFPKWSQQKITKWIEKNTAEINND